MIEDATDRSLKATRVSAPPSVDVVPRKADEQRRRYGTWGYQVFPARLVARVKPFVVDPRTLSTSHTRGVLQPSLHVICH